MTGRRQHVWLLVVAVAAALSGCTVGGAAGQAAPSAGGGPAAEEGPRPSPSARPLPEGTAEEMQAVLDAYLATQDAPGLTAAVVSPQGSWAGASGVDGVGEPLVPESASAIASITKTFVAAEVMLLVADGRVELDRPLDDYVDLPFHSGGASVREVLGMRSGFPLDPVEQMMSIQELDEEWTADDVFALVAPRSRQGLRGGDTSYNNLNYLALGELVEQVTGDPLAVALRRDVLDPAGLDRVWYQAAEEPEPPLAIAQEDPRAAPVDLDGPHLPSRSTASAAGAAGGMAADAPTLARWGHLLYGGEVVAPGLLAEMTAREDEEDWYGLGTMLLREEGEDGAQGVTAVGHAGNLGVYHSLLVVWPDSGTSVAVLVPGAEVWTLEEKETPLGLASVLQDLVHEG